MKTSLDFVVVLKTSLDNKVLEHLQLFSQFSLSLVSLTNQVQINEVNDFYPRGAASSFGLPVYFCWFLPCGCVSGFVFPVCVVSPQPTAYRLTCLT